jgi:hypothetical protein
MISQEQLRQNARIVILSQQIPRLGTNKKIKQLQNQPGVSRHQVRTLVQNSMGLGV